MTSREIGNFRFGAGNIPDEPIDLVIPKVKMLLKINGIISKIFRSQPETLPYLEMV